MTPVTHDSSDWQNLMTRVGELEKNQVAMKSDLTHFSQMQRDNHKENQENIVDLKLLIIGDEETPGLKTLMYAMNTNMGIVKWIGVTMVGFVISCAVILFAMWAQGHHISTNEPPTAHSMNETQHATIPPL